ncbi:sulfatase family protein [Gracilibacillus alcaliphilus]|uniref:sulfatase family protein n=1 Tax=Gracilibacillus alcaliphilus TaxID=1401441 RepID=UPI0019580923|nr:sulfatase [Gracilibacillus alcaliphilus]MBM7675628.1 arylsulfatase A-like enzyme [Gracilibacillus alcaliphilus]
MKIIMLSLDSLRADRLSSYGYHKPTSPYIDKIAAEGTLFEQAFASDIPTEAAHTSIFTGKVGLNTGIVSHGSSLTHLDKTPQWLPTLLKQAGFTTAAVDNLYQLKEWFARGYRYYINSVGEKRWIDGELVTSLAKDWLKEHTDEDFFLFLHYWDPHTPYLPPKEYVEPFYDKQRDPYDKSNYSMEPAYNHTAYPFFKQHHFDHIGDVRDTEYVNALYDAEVRYLDDKIKELDQYLEELHIKDDTLLILFGDHGESLTEHQIYWDHCGLYDVTVRVPLIMRWPQHIQANKRVKGMVQQVDLLPTIMESVTKIKGKQFADFSMDGKSLWPTLLGQEDSTHSMIYLSECAWQAARGVRTDEFKFIKTWDSGLFTRPSRELYDLKTDPEETNNIAEQRTDIADQLENKLHTWVETTLNGQEDPLVKQLNEEGLPFKKRIEQVLQQVGLSWEEWSKNPSKAAYDQLVQAKTK